LRAPCILRAPADNLFETSSPQALINVSSANDVLLYRDAIALIGQNARGPKQFPVAIHDASNVLFDQPDRHNDDRLGFAGP
jgi:hypothetical protein